jgi:hypothetical protein
LSTSSNLGQCDNARAAGSILDRAAEDAVWS